VDQRRRRHEELDLTRWELAGPKRTWKSVIPEAIVASEWDGRYAHRPGVVTAREFDLLTTRWE